MSFNEWLTFKQSDVWYCALLAKQLVGIILNPYALWSRLSWGKVWVMGGLDRDLEVNRACIIGTI